jgi:hypothetical protein
LNNKYRKNRWRIFRESRWNAVMQKLINYSPLWCRKILRA